MAKLSDITPSEGSSWQSSEIIENSDVDFIRVIISGTLNGKELSREDLIEKGIFTEEQLSKTEVSLLNSWDSKK